MEKFGIFKGRYSARFVPIGEPTPEYFVILNPQRDDDSYMGYRTAKFYSIAIHYAGLTEIAPELYDLIMDGWEFITNIPNLKECFTWMADELYGPENIKLFIEEMLADVRPHLTTNVVVGTGAMSGFLRPYEFGHAWKFKRMFKSFITSEFLISVRILNSETIADATLGAATGILSKENNIILRRNNYGDFIVGLGGGTLSITEKTIKKIIKKGAEIALKSSFSKSRDPAALNRLEYMTGDMEWDLLKQEIEVSVDYCYKLKFHGVENRRNYE